MKKPKSNTGAMMAAGKAKMKNLPPGTATTTSSSSSVSNSGQMSTQTSSTGAQGGAVNTTNIRVQGDPGFGAGQDSEAIRTWRGIMGL